MAPSPPLDLRVCDADARVTCERRDGGLDDAQVDEQSGSVDEAVAPMRGVHDREAREIAGKIAQERELIPSVVI